MLSCGVIGKGDLPRRCIEVLQEEGHEVRVLVSPDAGLRAWATARGIDVLSSAAQLRPGSPSTDIDYLFSIVNGEILPSSVLELPRRLAINYHNGPLPRYAGVNAASWAILNDERFHCITWHVMSERIDAGDILCQDFFPIGPRDTAASLNDTCRSRAVTAFRGLLDELSRGAEVRVPQDLSQRTYFAASRRIPGGGLLSWDRPASEIDLITRSHTLGLAPNTLGLPCFLLGDELFVPLDLEPTNTRSAAPPGTFERIGDAWTIATSTLDMRIRRVMDIDGKVWTTSELEEEYEHCSTRRLPIPGDDLLGAFGRLDAARTRSESFWLAELSRTSPPPVPPRIRGEAVTRSVVPPPDLAARLVETFHAPLERILLAGWIVEVTLTLGAHTVAVSTPRTRAAASGLERLTAAHLPLAIALPLAHGFTDVVRLVGAQLDRVEENAPCARDLPLRYPTRSLPVSLPLAAFLDDAALQVESAPSISVGTTTLALLSSALAAPDRPIDTISPRLHSC